MRKDMIFGIISGLAYASFMIGYDYFKGESFSFMNFSINFLWFGGGMILAQKIKNSK